MATAASSSSSMVATAVLIPRLPAASVGTTRFSALLPLPPRVSTASLSFSSSVKLTPESKRFSLLQTKASEETSVDAGDLFADLKEKWDKVEDKATVVLYGGGALVAVWLSSILIGAINSVPLLPKIMELVGVGYTGWFIYRYLLFKSSRKELATDIEALKNKITGTE
ncbi:protein CURVATURE THYLAKOID 1A, chloroplastic [Gossypium australe]|uniref:Protein CURVATURE THYLAKOID 1A, chloroplastic n=1 Tax=Gossypium australe TaxID=47621 RepID=A0A5B6W0G4_9ROSI|nr:protein CURVATURE THYLAKOID 1A, chloroplastic [Gossypium australe]